MMRTFRMDFANSGIGLRLLGWFTFGGLSIWGVTHLLAGWVETQKEVYNWRNDWRFQHGSLVIAGGGPIPDEIRGCVADLAGGPEARLVVIPAAPVGQATRDVYANNWRKAGVREVWVWPSDDDSAANRERLVVELKSATGVWIGGGVQNWLTERFVDSPVETELHNVLERGGVIGGSSAGAAVMTRVMIAGGQETVEEGRGFDFLPGAIVDQHLLRRNRFHRFTQFLQRHRDHIGVGIDEQTAVVVGLKREFLQVIGQSFVLVHAPATAEHSGRTEFLKPGDHFHWHGFRAGDPIGKRLEIEGFGE